MGITDNHYRMPSRRTIRLVGRIARYKMYPDKLGGIASTDRPFAKIYRDRSQISLLSLSLSEGA